MKSLEARGLASNSNRPQPSPSGLGGPLLLWLPPRLLCCPGAAGTGPSPSPPRKTRKRDAEEKGTEQSVLSSGVDSSHAPSRTQGRVWGPGQQGGGIFDDFPVFRWQPTWPAPCSLPAWVAGDLGLRGCGGGSRNSWTGPLHRTSRAESRWVCRACAARPGHVHAPAQDPHDPQPWTQAGILRAKARGLAGGRKVHPGADICTAQPGWSPWTTSMLS